MPSPPDVRTDCFVDAVALAGAGSTVERAFSLADLQRLAEMGAASNSAITARIRFSEFDTQPVVKGRLQGRIVLTCQRCLNPVQLEVGEAFQVMVVDQERSDEPGGYEPVLADPSRLDLCWLVEDQLLLAMPLVPMHEPGECEGGEKGKAEKDGAASASGVQKPFQNLRDIMRKR